MTDFRCDGKRKDGSPCNELIGRLDGTMTGSYETKCHKCHKLLRFFHARVEVVAAKA